MRHSLDQSLLGASVASPIPEGVERTIPLAERPPAEPASAVLRVEGLRKSFRHGLPPRRRKIEVLKDADLEVRAGELESVSRNISRSAENSEQLRASPGTDCALSGAEPDA